MQTSLSMAFEKKEAQELIQDELYQVSEHIAKIWVYAPSKWDKKWEAVIASFFTKIIRVANNLKPSKNKISFDFLTETISDCFALAIADRARAYRKESFKRLKKTSSDQKIVCDAANTILAVALLPLADKVATLILVDDVDQDVVIANLIASTVVKTRNEYFKICNK